MKSFLFLVVICFFLMGCAMAGPSRFERAGISTEQMQGDLQDCSQKASSPTSRFLAVGLIGLATADEGRAWEIERCMVGRGYRCVENCDRGTGKVFTGK